VVGRLHGLLVQLGLVLLRVGWKVGTGRIDLDVAEVELAKEPVHTRDLPCERRRPPASLALRFCSAEIGVESSFAAGRSGCATSSRTTERRLATREGRR